MKPDLRLDRFLDQFVVGSLIFLGSWYLHRPFLIRYFPNVAAGRSAEPSVQFEFELALLLFAIGSVCFGILVGHMADLATVAAFVDESTSEKSTRAYRLWFRRLARIVTWWPSPDPRVRGIRRYLDSPRRQQFLELMREWAMSTEPQLRLSSEAVLAHQHLVVRLRTASAWTKTALEEHYSPVVFAGSLFVALSLLVVISLLSFWTSSLVEPVHPVQPNKVKIAATVALYIGAVVSGASFRRRFRDFCGSVVTLALYFHANAAPTAHEKQPNPGIPQPPAYGRG